MSSLTDINATRIDEKSSFFHLEEMPVDFNYVVEDDSSIRIEIIDDYIGETPASIKGQISLGRNSKCEIVFISFSSRNVKADISADLSEFSNISIDVASIADKNVHKTFDIKTIHQGGNSTSFTKMYGVLLDQAKLEFLGTSDIKKGSIKSWTRQEGKIADLSVKGSGQVSPILKISEDDVKASHGAALGKIPEDSMFYMMSRGLTKKEASALITIGYLKPIVDEVKEAKYKSIYWTMSMKRGFQNKR